jgi:hypothetical protein
MSWVHKAGDTMRYALVWLLRITAWVLIPSYLLYSHGSDALRNPGPLTAAFALISAYYAAACLYYVRISFRRTYGLIEIAIGLAAVYYSVPRFADPTPLTIVQIGAGIYIIIRGIDNVDQGMLTKSGLLWKVWLLLTFRLDEFIAARRHPVISGTELIKKTGL